MSSYKSSEWQNWNRFDFEFGMQGTYIGERHTGEKKTIKIAKSRLLEIHSKHQLFEHKQKQKVVNALNKLLAQNLMEFDIVSEGENKKDGYLFIEIKLGDCLLAIINEGGKPRIEEIRFLGPEIGYTPIICLFEAEIEQAIIEKAISMAPKVRVKWLFS